MQTILISKTQLAVRCHSRAACVGSGKQLQSLVHYLLVPLHVSAGYKFPDTLMAPRTSPSL